MKGLVLKILRGTYPEIPGQYSMDLKNLISSMLIKDPVKRPSITKVLEMKFLESRVSKMFLNATSKYELEADQIGKKMAQYSSIHNRIHEKSERNALRDLTNISKDKRSNKVVKNYINFKKGNKKSLKIIQSQSVMVTKGDKISINKQKSIEEEKEPSPIQKFLQDLPGVCSSDSISYRIEALRVYLEEKLGDTDFINAYNYYKNASELDEKVEEEVEYILGPRKKKYVGLIYQLIVCEDTYCNK
jgi:hypothetical protein